MNVLVIGSGGREHVLGWKLAQSPKLTKLYFAPGNAGMSKLGECLPVKADDLEGLLKVAKEKKIDLTVVGPEIPLVKGIVDLFEKEDQLIFGPNQRAAQLEGSKIFSKEIMKEAKVPTASFHVFTEINEAKRCIIDLEPPIVIKADGLAAGKGVVIAHSCEEGIEAVNKMIEEKIFGDAGTRVVIEDFLVGTELSVLVLTDGENVIPLASSQDHKRAFDNDEGPNTGGMGAYSPCPFIDEIKLNDIVKLTAKPVIDVLKRRGISYRGILYVGVMLTEKGPFVLEYNVRFGDPEAQAVLPRLKTDLLDVCYQVAKGHLETTSLEWEERACLSVAVVSGGYPGSYKTDYPVSGLKEIELMKDVFLFHAGTKLNSNGEVCTAGGRVFNVSALGNSLREAYDKAYEAVRHVSFKDAKYRTDIGKHVLQSSATLKI